MNNIDDKLIIAKLMDKIKICKIRNKITNTEFLTTYQREIIQKELNKIKFKNYIFFGGYEEAESKILIIYPDKLTEEIIKNNLKDLIKAIKIELPKELEGKFNHRDYLGVVMQAGLKRDRIGDIIVYKDKSYIFVLKENAEYIKETLKQFSRFNKAKVEIINYEDVEIKEPEFQEMRITVSSFRLDNIVSEIIRISRSKAEELLKNEKVFLNSKLEVRSTISVNENDILAIRGFGKYIIWKFLGSNKKGKNIITVKKYI